MLTFENVKNLVASESAQLFDVRGIVEYEEGHLEGAQNIAHTRLYVRREEVPHGKTLVVYCRTGNRAAAASSLLERLGHEVKYVDDEITNWADLVTLEATPA